MPDDVVAQIADRTDGVPLFVEEWTKSVLESGLLREEQDRWVLDRELPPFAIPTSLHASLLARLDRLASVRHVAQIGAVIGRQFPYALLCAVSRMPKAELQAALTRLVASELVFQRGTPPDAVYGFKHALVQEATYGSLLRNTRQQLHGRIAAALETHFPELTETQPELLALHYTEAGHAEKSMTYWGKAGHRSAARSAMAEAAAQLQKGLDQLALLSSTSERQRQELELRSVLAAVPQAVKGFAARETGHAYARARELWEQLGSPTEYLQVPFGQSRYHVFRGELDLAQRLDEDLMNLSRQRNDSAGLVLSHLSFGRNLYVAGGFALSRSHLEAGLALFDPIFDRALAHQVGVSPGVALQAYLGHVLVCLGYSDQGLAQNSAAIAEARKLAHPPTLAAGLTLGIQSLALVGDDAIRSEWVDELAAVTSERGFPLWGTVGALYRGWVNVRRGDVVGGILLLRGALSANRATGAVLFTPQLISLLARACAIAGQIEEAVTQLDDALKIVERTGERWFAAELNRLKGCLLLRQGHTEAAEELYCKALSTAREQQAKLWELRAAVHLAHLRRDQGRCAEALDLLAPIYGWFTGGFATPDLQEARALLDELDA